MKAKLVNILSIKEKAAMSRACSFVFTNFFHFA